MESEYIWLFSILQEFTVSAIVTVDNCSSNITVKHSSDAMRIEPEFLDNNGQVFWKLKSYNSECAVLLQGNF